MIDLSTIRTVLLVLLLSAPAARAELLSWQGTLSVEIDQLPAVSQPVGGLAVVNGSGGGGHLSTLSLLSPAVIAGTTSLTTATFVSDPVFLLAPSSVAVAATLQPGVLRPISGGGPLTQGSIPLPGGLRICVLLPTPCTAPTFELPLTSGGTLGVGIGGTVTRLTNGVRFSIAGAPWTVATTSVTFQSLTANNGLTSLVSARRGFAHGPASLTSSTANLDGVLQLVTPIAITSELLGATAPGFATLTVRFVPEPSGFLLPMSAGSLALALLGWRRRR